jgi:hypothetical protein
MISVVSIIKIIQDKAKVLPQNCVNPKIQLTVAIAKSVIQRDKTAISPEDSIQVKCSSKTV